ncbi:MAG: hypothetical protein AB7K52_11245 [Phycisphaerales bacterium]
MIKTIIVVGLMAAHSAYGRSCENSPTGNPLCDGILTVQPIESFLPPLPGSEGLDGMGFKFETPFGGCESPCTGESFAGVFNTAEIGETRYYHLLLLDGPGADEEWYFTTFEGGYDALKEMLESSGYDLQCTYTDAFVTEWGAWADAEWISVGDFHTQFEY